MSSRLVGNRPAEILLVEDNENDVMLTRLAFGRSKFRVNVHHVSNGEECLAFLRNQGPHAEVARPDLVLLDLNMPRMTGQEVLAELSTDERLRDIPIVILTTSADKKEVLDMYKLKCSSYTVKPVDFDEFLRLISVLADYWLTVVELPRA